jgi:hypothetical protein
MTPAEFKELALALREAGAVKVRAGELEVIWGAPLSPSVAAQSGFTRAKSPQMNGQNGKERAPGSAEEARMQAYRRELAGEDD